MHPPLYQPLVYEDNVNILKNIFVIEESLLITKCLVPVATGEHLVLFIFTCSSLTLNISQGQKCSS